MDGAETWELEAGRTLTPSLDIGLRHDAGDAETGLALEAAGAPWQVFSSDFCR